MASPGEIMSGSDAAGGPKTHGVCVLMVQNGAALLNNSVLIQMPRDYTDQRLKLTQMYSPVLVAVSHT